MGNWALKHITNNDKKCTCPLEVATQLDCLEESPCLQASGFWTDYSLPVSSCALRGLIFSFVAAAFFASF